MKNARILTTFAAAVVLLTLPFAAFARIGVGVGIGKINLDEALKPGAIYELPVLPVLNTGDEASDYEATVEYFENAPQMRPASSWFTFEPQHFHLEPGAVQPVAIHLSIPLQTVPGEYFAFLEGHPLKKSISGGGSRVGVAAAAKLYFTVAPSNVFTAVYYRVLSLLQRSAPWSYGALGLIAFAGLVVLFRKYFKFELAISKKGKK